MTDVTISTGPGEGRDDQVSESQTLLGSRRAEEHGMLGVCAAEISYCCSKRRLRAMFQVTGLYIKAQLAAGNVIRPIHCLSYPLRHK